MAERSTTPALVLQASIKPVNATDRDRLMAVLSRLKADDPGFDSHGSPLGPHIVIKGNDEPHLEGIVESVIRVHGIAVTTGPPEIAYRETVTRSALRAHVLHCQSRDGRPVLRVTLRLEPRPRGSGNHPSVMAAPAAVQSAVLDAVAAGIDAGYRAGVVAGFPVVDVESTLVDVQIDEPNPGFDAILRAAEAAFKAAMTAAAPQLMEPIMTVEVVTPEDHMGDVIGDLNSRRGAITSMDTRGNTRVVTASVPLGNLFGYASALAAITRGRATYKSSFESYQAVPRNDPGPNSPAQIMRRA